MQGTKVITVLHRLLTEERSQSRQQVLDLFIVFVTEMEGGNEALPILRRGFNAPGHVEGIAVSARRAVVCIGSKF